MEVSLAEASEQAARELRDSATYLIFKAAFPVIGGEIMKTATLLTRAAAMAMENEALRHDIERHMGIASEYARDAQRYRWLRDKKAYYMGNCWGMGYVMTGVRERHKLDEAIDAAIAAQDAKPRSDSP